MLWFRVMLRHCQCIKIHPCKSPACPQDLTSVPIRCLGFSLHLLCPLNDLVQSPASRGAFATAIFPSWVTPPYGTGAHQFVVCFRVWRKRAFILLRWEQHLGDEQETPSSLLHSRVVSSKLQRLGEADGIFIAERYVEGEWPNVHVFQGPKHLSTASQGSHWLIYFSLSLP